MRYMLDLNVICRSKVSVIIMIKEINVVIEVVLIIVKERGYEFIVDVDGIFWFIIVDIDCMFGILLDVFGVNFVL